MSTEGEKGYTEPKADMQEGRGAVQTGQVDKKRNFRGNGRAVSIRSKAGRWGHDRLVGVAGKRWSTRVQGMKGSSVSLHQGRKRARGWRTEGKKVELGDEKSSSSSRTSGKAGTWKGGYAGREIT